MMLPPTSGGSSKTPVALAEINIIPLVDVMLVLLIIFMVSAPMMSQGVQVDLPKANSQGLTDVPDQVFLSVSSTRELSLNGKAIPSGTLRARLEGMVQAKPGLQVYVQADQKIPYGFIAQVIAEVKNAKVQKVGLVTQPGDPNQRL
jgi:biopolymer transport protein TolR